MTAFSHSPTPIPRYRPIPYGGAIYRQEILPSCLSRGRSNCLDRNTKRGSAVALTLKSAVQRRKHLAEAKCTEEACLRRGHSPKVNPKGAQACARRGGSMDFLMESGFMHWMSERMSFTNWVKADFHETSRITLKFSAPPRLRERYRLGAGSSRYGNCFF